MDAQLSQQEVELVLDGWYKSRAMTPDLCPRTAVMCRDALWRKVLWKTSGCLALVA